MLRRGKRSIQALLLSSAALVFLAALSVAHAQTYTILHTFTGPDGAGPSGALVRDAAGNLYGTAFAGGKNGSNCIGGCGTVFRLSPNGIETVLYGFTGGTDGGGPKGLFRDATGDFYGVAGFGGDLSLCQVLGASSGCGVVFKLSPPATFCRAAICYWTETVLHTFTGPDGAGPVGSLIQDSAGNFYGATLAGGTGTYTGGTVFELSSAGQETVLLSFVAGGSGGDAPLSGVIQDSAGMLYGTTHYGGNTGYGVLYKVNPATGQETVLHSFNNENDGGYPNGPPVFDQAGNFYGSTEQGGNFQGENCYSGCGVIYKLDTNGDVSLLYAFTGGADGWWPVTGLLRDAAGNLYGATLYGGNEQAQGCNPGGCGVVFKLDANGNLTVLHAFDRTDGESPAAALIQDSAGNLYGSTTGGGGFDGYGVIFKITP